MSYERCNYEAVADAPQSKTIFGKTFQIINPPVKG